MKTILMVDDDAKLGQLVKQYLKDFGLNVILETLPQTALNNLHKHSPELAILDVMLPEMDGFELCRKIREQSPIPILMLTARGDVTDRVVGLQIGADDYLAKPFDPRELVARVQSLLRRISLDQKLEQKREQQIGQKTNSKPEEIIQLQALDLVLNLVNRTALLNGVDLCLTTGEFEILKLFMQRPGQALNRDKIMDLVKGINWEAYNRSIDIAISRVRQKLKDSAKAPRFLKTIWGEGYIFIAPVVEVK